MRIGRKSNEKQIIDTLNRRQFPLSYLSTACCMFQTKKTIADLHIINIPSSPDHKFIIT